jgi:hypothetical protein
MRRQIKDAITSVLLILLFTGVIAGAAYFIFKVMTHWNVKGLG